MSFFVKRLNRTRIAIVTDALDAGCKSRFASLPLVWYGYRIVTDAGVASVIRAMSQIIRWVTETVDPCIHPDVNPIDEIRIIDYSVFNVLLRAKAIFKMST
jgi:hypothetical protein